MPKMYVDSMPIEKVLARLSNVAQTSDRQWEARCPVHDDSTNSLCVGIYPNGRDVGVYCQSCGQSGTRKILQTIGLELKDLFAPRIRQDHPNGPRGSGSSLGAGGSNDPHNRNGRAKLGKIVEEYVYRDEDGNALYRVCRHEPKAFRQYAKLPGEGWAKNNKGTRPVLYRLPEIVSYIAACRERGETPHIVIVEGEKDVDRLRSLGYIATTNAGGAADLGSKSKWFDEFSQFLIGCDIVLIQDNDDKGEQHINYVAASIRRAADAAADFNTTIRVLKFPQPELPEPPLPKGFDASDYLDGIPEHEDKKKLGDIIPAYPPSGNEENLANLIGAAPDWKPGILTQSGISHYGDSTAYEPNKADKDPHRLARVVFKKFEEMGIVLRLWRNRLFLWQNDHYEEIDRKTFESEHLTDMVEKEFNRINIERQMENPDKVPVCDQVTIPLVRNVFNALVKSIIIKDKVSEFTWLNEGEIATERQPFIALKNGILDVSSLFRDQDDCLLTHSPKWFSAFCLDYAFNPDATCPGFLSYIETSLDGNHDLIALAQQWMGYLLLPDSDEQKFMVLHGEAGRGKSVLLAVIRAVLGDSNCSSVSLEKFGDRFGLAPTLGKLVNICADQNVVERIPEGDLKQFTSGDLMTFERKGVDGFSAVPTARLMISCNKMPRFHDKSEGIKRRMLVIPFNHKIPKHAKRKGMDKVGFWIKSGELPGIFNWALQGLLRLREAGEFVEPKDSATAIDEYEKEMHPERLFFDEFIKASDPMPDKDHPENFIRQNFPSIKCQQLYEVYVKWTQKSNHKWHMTAQHFGEQVRDRLKTVRLRDSTGEPRPYRYYGIDWKEESLEGVSTT